MLLAELLAESLFPSRSARSMRSHLASADFLRERHAAIQLATYDPRLAAAARAIGIPLHTLAGSNEASGASR